MIGLLGGFGCGRALGRRLQAGERGGAIVDDARDRLQLVLGVARALHALALGAHVVEEAADLVQHLAGDDGDVFFACRFFRFPSRYFSFFTSP